MGRLNHGPNGPFSGKAGSLIGSSWREIYYIKGLQKKSTKPPSPLQIESQQRFALAVRFLTPVKDVVDMGFSDVNPGGATGYNMALSHMLKNSIIGTYPDLEINYPTVLFTQGRLALPETITMDRDELTLKLNWSTESDKHRSFITDTVEVLVYSPTQKSFVTSTGNDLRNQGELTLPLAESFKGGAVHVYLYVFKDKGKKRSNSFYVGSLQVGK